MKLNVGEKWGRLECIKVGLVTVAEYALDDNGQKYDTGAGEEYLAYSLQCDCGKTVEVKAVEFLGKRSMKDCGCGLTADDGANITSAVSMPLGIFKALQKYAEEKTNGNRSRAVTILVRKGLEAEVILEPKQEQLNWEN